MIYDCFTFFNELDILEIRLNELAPVVDRFIIVEADQTFRGQPKPLHFAENASRFAAFSDKIIHIVCRFPDEATLMREDRHKADSAVWAREFRQRNEIARGLEQAGPDDLVIVSDVDEIIRAAVLRQAVASRSGPELTIFTMPLHKYYVNRRLISPEWRQGPRMVAFRDFRGAQLLRRTRLHGTKKLKSEALRQVIARAWNGWHCGCPLPIRRIRASGWHFSTIGGWEKLRLKYDSYSHDEGRQTAAYRDMAGFMADMLGETVPATAEELPLWLQDERRMPHLRFDHAAQASHAAGETPPA